MYTAYCTWLHLAYLARCTHKLTTALPNPFYRNHQKLRMKIPGFLAGSLSKEMTSSFLERCHLRGVHLERLFPQSRSPVAAPVLSEHPGIQGLQNRQKPKALSRKRVVSSYESVLSTPQRITWDPKRRDPKGPHTPPVFSAHRRSPSCCGTCCDLTDRNR